MIRDVRYVKGEEREERRGGEGGEREGGEREGGEGRGESFG
jgi:hypothetical protein